jgi:SPP1 gp7 family putative phage head morphogenesis protein
MPALEQSVQIESRHAVFINRFAGGLHNQFLPFLEDMAKQLAVQLRNNPPVTEWSRKRLNNQLSDVKSLMGAVFTEYNKDLFDDLKEFSAHEAAFEAQALEKVIESKAIEVTLATDVQAFAAVTSQPLIVGDTAVLLNPFIKEWEASQVRRVQNVVRSGFFQGQTIDQMVRAISGKGGVLDKKTRASNRAVIRTATNHVSSIARETTIEENDDITTGYEWVSTLDSRTSSQCKSLDGTEFLRKNKGKEFQPKPPIHINCRSTIAPILDKRFGLDDSDATRASKGAEGGQQVQADQTYYSWLKTQPKPFIRETLGKSRSELFLNGGLTSDEFSKLSVDKLFRPLSLSEMRAKDPMSFDDAGI